MHDRFRRFAQAVSHVAGSGPAFGLAVGIVIVWMVSGPLFGFSNTWQLAINTGTTIVTFLMVFLIQNTQNRDATALHLKLDELLRGMKGARTGLVGLEDLSDEELKKLHGEFEELAKQRGFSTDGDDGHLEADSENGHHQRGREHRSPA
ncbi:MAG TPA: low affinity iron permease family protein [Dehalococcoidia bacterium]|nr:low affinity iron permease family protein [Dehalococcoidia bacterium]